MKEMVFLIIIKLAPCEYGIMIDDYALKQTFIAHAVQPIGCKKQPEVARKMTNKELDMYLKPFGGPAFLVIDSL